MTSLFREMMPDNFLELAFTGGLTFSISYVSLKTIKYYKDKGLSAKEIEREFQKILEEKDLQIKAKEEELLQKLKEMKNNTLSDEAKEYLRSL